MNKAKDLRAQSLQELDMSYNEACKKLFDLRNRAKNKEKVVQPHEIRHARKDIARLKTVMTELESSNG